MKSTAMWRATSARAENMASLFAYTARNNEGRFVAGSLQAENREQALAHLRTRALFVTSLLAGDGATAAIVTAWPVSAKARTAFFRSFATLIRAGVPIRRSLDVVIDSCRDGRLREALRSVSSDIESGSELSSAMARRPREFHRLHVALIRAGELGGSLDEILERLAALLEQNLAVRKRLQSALAYPVIVACAALALVCFLVGSTVPAFASMFAEMHVPLPWSTRALIVAGNALKNPAVWLALAAVPVAAAGLYRAVRRAAPIAVRIDQVLLAAPVIGALLRKSVIARLSRTLGTLLHSGVPLLAALDAAQEVVENAVYSAFARDLVQALREGTPIAGALERSALFEGLVLQLVGVGEETGTLDAMLVRIAEYYELDVETAVSTLGSVVEPVLIIGLGALIGVIVASILVPLYSMIGSIK
jgi:type IV pilus assembly protein PilC